ncbi:AzlC family ABC transporter permease [Hutsoniella sourekii]
MKESFKFSFPKTIPIMAGYIFMGMSYGILAVSQGLGAWLTIIMSLIVYSGAMQFASVNLLTSSFDPLSSFLLTIMISARHIFYGIAMLPIYSRMERFKNYTIFTLTDETFSLNLSLEAPSSINKEEAYFHISWLNQAYWVIGTLLGVLFSQLITVSTEGIDFVLTALFVATFTDQWIEARDHRPALIGIACSLISLLIFGAGNFMIPAMIAIICCLIAMNRLGGGGHD